MSQSDKAYDATIELGAATTTFDSEGDPVGPSYGGPWPDTMEIERALEEFRGTFLQQPPVYSAKRIAGKRSYAMARRAASRTGVTGVTTIRALPVPAPIRVTTSRVELLGVDDGLVRLHIHCSAGFYVRSLAHDLGQRLGTGARLVSLRRTRSGHLTLDHTIQLNAIEEPEHGREAAASALVPLARMLPELRRVVLTSAGIRRATTGRDVGPEDSLTGFDDLAAPGAPGVSDAVRLLTETGDLIGIAGPSKASGFLHPVLVLM
jgi:tRNA pseudouridine55 synthase